MNDLIEKWKNFVVEMNSKGIPVPMIRDPKTGSSVSLTLVFISFNVWLLSIIGKAAGALGGMDPSQTLNMFIVCAGLYFGRKFQKDEKGAISVEGKDDEKPV
jgi:hypothetical protein